MVSPSNRSVSKRNQKYGNKLSVVSPKLKTKPATEQQEINAAKTLLSIKKEQYSKIKPYQHSLERQQETPEARRTEEPAETNKIPVEGLKNLLIKGDYEGVINLLILKGTLTEKQRTELETAILEKSKNFTETRNDEHRMMGLAIASLKGDLTILPYCLTDLGKTCLNEREAHNKRRREARIIAMLKKREKPPTTGQAI